MGAISAPIKSSNPAPDGRRRPPSKRWWVRRIGRERACRSVREPRQFASGHPLSRNLIGAETGAISAPIEFSNPGRMGLCDPSPPHHPSRNRRRPADENLPPMKRRRPRQLPLPGPRTWGGIRDGAGRKPLAFRTGPPHRRRPEHNHRHPVHVTLRTVPLPVSLRSEPVFSSVSRALSASSSDGFRLLQFSVQSDHLHLMVEADTQEDLVRGLQGLSVRCSRAINLAVRRSGSVWRARYHGRALTTPREVRAALVYVLLNFRKHLRAAPGIDPCSSGPWFDGWAHQPTLAPPPVPVARAHSWLAALGWRRGGPLLGCGETPAARPVLRRSA